MREYYSLFWKCVYLDWVEKNPIEVCSTFGVIHLQISKTKNGRQDQICYIFLLQIFARFLFSAWLRVDKLMSHIFDQNDLYLTSKFKMVTGNTQRKTVFMHVNYNITNNIFLMELKKKMVRNTTDWVAKHSKLCFIRSIFQHASMCLVFKMTSLF